MILDVQVDEMSRWWAKEFDRIMLMYQDVLMSSRILDQHGKPFSKSIKVSKTDDKIRVPFTMRSLDAR